jgi:lipoate-protein ligase A
VAESARWRLIRDSEADGALNMGLDEAILEAVARGDSPPTLRFYRWNPTCLSIGYAQKADAFDLDALRRRGWGFVRRPSGGRAVLHHREVTYCVAAPASDWRMAGGVLESYRRLSDGFLHGLKQLGLGVSAERQRTAGEGSSAACFDAPSRYELTADGRKLVGSAQWRRGEGVLQHGSIPLSGDVAEVVDYLMLPEADRERARALLLRRAGTVEQALGREVEFAEVAMAVAAGLGETLGITWEEAPLTDDEIRRASELAETKYATNAWNFRS